MVACNHPVFAIVAQDNGSPVATGDVDAAGGADRRRKNEIVDALKPQRVKDAEAEGIEVRRQGDVFLIRVTEKDWNLELGRDMLAKDHRLWDRTHVASKALIADDRVFVSGKLTHERRQHRAVFFKGVWYEAVKNTALASWNAVGYVD